MKQDKPRRANRVLVHALGEESILYDSRDDAVHVLNVTAARVFELCNGQRQGTDIARIIGDEFARNCSSLEIECSVERVLRDFARHNLIESDQS